MKKLGTFILASMMVCMATVSAYADNGDRRTLTTTGEAWVKVKNNQAVVRLGVTTRSIHAEEAAELNSEVMDKVRNAIFHAGIAMEKIETQRYNLSEVTEYKKDDIPIHRYEAENCLTVTVDDINRAGTVIDMAVSAGANRIDSVEFTAKNPEKAKEEALRKAIEEARKKADLMAASLGKQIVNVVSVNEGSVDFTSRYIGGRQGVDGMLYLAKSSTSFSGGDSMVKALVTIVFEIA